MATKQQEFLDSELPKHLQPGEKVLLRGVAEDPIRWVFATLTLGLLSFRRIFYYVVLTDRRLLLLRSPSKRYFVFTPFPGLRASAGMSVSEVRALDKGKVKQIVVNRQSPAHMMLGWRSLAMLLPEGGSIGLFIKRGAFGFPGEQSRLYNEFVGKTAETLSAEAKAVGK